MKKLKSTIPNGGAPLGEFPVFRELFNDEIFDAMEAILHSVYDDQTEGCILKGCEVSGAGPYDISEGLVYVDGEILRFDAVTGQTLPKYIAKAAVTGEGGEFADGVTKNYIDVHEAELVSSTPGSGQYVTVNSSGGSRLKDRLGDFLNDGVVTGSKLANDSVTSSKIQSGSVTLSKVSSQVATSEIITTDLNDYNKAGMFIVGSGETNAPTTSAGMLFVAVNNVGAGIVDQLYIITSGAGVGTIYYRNYIGSWGAWALINNP